jgi:hypothetical protein
VTNVLHAISPPSAKAAIKLSLLILYCPVLTVGFLPPAALAAGGQIVHYKG